MKRALLAVLATLSACGGGSGAPDGAPPPDGVLPIDGAAPADAAAPDAAPLDAAGAGAVLCSRDLGLVHAGDIARLSDGAFVLVGWFQGSVTLGVGETHETTLASAGQSDAFIARFAPDCSLDWALRLGGTGTDAATGVAASADDTALVVSGNFADAVTFGVGDPLETTLTAAGPSDAFVARFDGAGVLAWARAAGGAGTNDDQALGIVWDGDGVRVIGAVSGSAVFGAGEAGETTVNGGPASGFVARLAADGDLVWVRLIAATITGWSIANAVSVLADGSGFVTGVFTGTVVLGAGEANEATFTSLVDGGYDAFLARYAPDGTLTWTRRVLSDSLGIPSTWPIAIDVDETTQSVLQGGSYGDLGVSFSESSVFGPGEPAETTLSAQDGLVLPFEARYDGTSGALVWAHDAGANDVAWLADGTYIAADAIGFAHRDASGTLLWHTDAVGMWARVNDFAPDGSAVSAGNPDISGGATVVASYGP